MSWDSYVKDQLMVPGGMVGAAIYGKDGLLWAKEGPVEPKSQEVKNIVSLIEKNERGDGIQIAGAGYLNVTPAYPDEYSIQLAPKKTEGPETEKYFCTAYLANTCLIFAFAKDKNHCNDCGRITGKLRDYLKSSNM